MFENPVGKRNGHCTQKASKRLAEWFGPIEVWYANMPTTQPQELPITEAPTPNVMVKLVSYRMIPLN